MSKAVTCLSLLFLCLACETDEGGRIKQDLIQDDEAKKETLGVRELGRYLFYERRLSLNHDRSCGICHEQAKAFTDGFVRAVGTSEELHPRNTLSLINVVHRESLGWISQTSHLESQMLTPLFGTTPVEMGLEEVWSERLSDLNNDPVYKSLLENIKQEKLDLELMTQAIAEFERTLVSYRAPYDEYLAGNKNALTLSAQRGLKLFEEALPCQSCHGGQDFDQPDLYILEDLDEQGCCESLRHAWVNTGLYNLDGRYPMGREGLYELSQSEQDIGKYRIPTLRNLSFTAPYYHDGSGASLIDVLSNYNQGGRITRSGPFAGDGRSHPNKHPLIQALDLSQSDLEDLRSFLLSLNDASIINDPRFSDPWSRD